MRDIFFAIWFFLPAGIANVTPIFAARIPVLNAWNYPLDFFKKLHGKRIFGDHKTVRGLISGIILGMLTSLCLFYCAKYFSSYIPSWYFSANPLSLGLLLSLGALTGDAIKSFFKRKIAIEPGSTWIPFDQIDYILGGLILSSFIHPLTFTQYIWVIVLWLGIHVISTYIGYFLRLKSQPL